jgi:predicted ribosomally synthesized peptide with SipW-like signal peptide
MISPRTIITAAAAIALAVCAAVIATGGTYALWNNSLAVDSSATLSSGSATLVVTTALTMPTTPLYPGATVYGSAVVKNTGTVPLTLRTTGLTIPTSNTLSQALTVKFATAADAPSCAAGTVTSSWVSSTFAAPTTAPVGSPVAVGASSVLCVAVSLSSTVATSAQGQSALNFVAVVDGIQS